ncbi:MAG: response regulator transcription factor [Gammaproteobacteria bacterium]|nr:response regulator transcription factor [Gammaproteobacteria bacterium]
MSSKPRLLIIEDEAPIRNGLVDVFLFHGFEVESAEEGTRGLSLALAGNYDLVLLDLMLPGLNGFDLCERLRAARPDQPVIMLTARSSDEDIVHGLTLGADDYVAKPFSVTQLVLRVQAVLRRTRPPGETRQSIRLGESVEIDCDNLAARTPAGEVRFTRREMEIVRYLASHAGRAVSREELLEEVWGYARNLGLETRTVDIHIAKLRRKIEPDPGSPSFLVTVRGVGYRLLQGP